MSNSIQITTTSTIVVQAETEDGFGMPDTFVAYTGNDEQVAEQFDAFLEMVLTIVNDLQGNQAAISDIESVFNTLDDNGHAPCDF